jgi:hypothetical protein
VSSKAKDRALSEWFSEIKKGAIKLPRFQRFEAWDKHRISSLLRTVIHDLPLGITLVLEVDKEQFISRYLETAEPSDADARVTEHLLDGQQRLTALWRVLHNNYPDMTYFIYVPELENYFEEPWSEDWEVFARGRYYKGDRLFPLWADIPADCLQRGLIPTNLLKPTDMGTDLDNWIEQATESLKGDDPEQLRLYYETKEKIKNIINTIRENVKHYNLPYLALPSETHKDTALQVFINMNTNSKPLSRYDIIVAEIEAVRGESLHDLQADLDNQYPTIKEYEELNKLILTVSALLQSKLPNERGAIEMDKAVMLDNWPKLENGLNAMTEFLESEGIMDGERLPTNAVLAVIAALYSSIPDKGDIKGGADVLLRRYLWSSFFTDRYENSAATHAYNDFIALNKAIEDLKSSKQYNITSIPVLDTNRYPLADVEELIDTKWPKKANIRARAILALSTYLGAQDFADGKTLSRTTISERDYHHLYPDSLLKEAETESYLALNCALITDVTNRHLIRRKDPSVYVDERRDWIDEVTLRQRLHSHIIPIEELGTKSYTQDNEEVRASKIREDFNAFLEERAKLVYAAAALLSQGQHIDYAKVEKQRSALFPEDASQ